jgi:acyl-CoA thioester hydrolase
MIDRAIEAFPSRSTDKIRYADTDRQGHVNNALYAAYLETGRVEILYDLDRPLAADGAEFVIAHLSLDFRAELRWPGTVTVGTGVRTIGRSSVTLEQAIYQGGRCVALAEAVVVHVDSSARTSRPLTEDARARLEALRLPDR